MLKNCEATGLIFGDTSRGKNLSALVDEVRPKLPTLREAIAMGDLPAIAAAADPKLVLPDEKYGELVAAIVQAKKPDTPPTVDELCAFCRANLPPQKAPEKWFIVTQYPMTSTGKIQKNVLQTWVAEKKIEAVAWTRPTGKAEA